MATTHIAPAPSPVQHVSPPPKPAWQKYGTPVLVILLAIAIIFTITHNWNAWEGGGVEQATNDAFVRGDVTPLSTKVPGLVREVKVGDYQQVHKGDVLVQLEDDDFTAQVAQAAAAVEAAKAAIANNRRQRDLQDSKILRAGAGIDQGNAQIAAAQAARTRFKPTSHAPRRSAPDRRTRRLRKKWRLRLPMSNGSPPWAPAGMPT
jgi:multidrug resistance efflux pump